MVPSRRGSGSAVFAAITTFAPSRAALSAIASPIPRLPPEMKRVLPARLMVVSGILTQGYAYVGSTALLPVKTFGRQTGSLMFVAALAKGRQHGGAAVSSLRRVG